MVAHACLKFAITACGLWDSPQTGHAQYRREQFKYVSFLYTDGHVYGTRNKIHIPEHTDIWVTGSRTRLARCGNAASDTPITPVLPINLDRRATLALTTARRSVGGETRANLGRRTIPVRVTRFRVAMATVLGLALAFYMWTAASSVAFSGRST